MDGQSDEEVERLLRGGLFSQRDFDQSASQHGSSRFRRGIPDWVGGFDVLEELGRGGMGSVYRGREPQTGREVAIKTIRPGIAQVSVVRERFLREARLVAKLRHPNLVSAISAGEQDGFLFMVMELVPGQDLAERLRTRGPLPPAEAVALVRQVGAGLVYAHRQGVLHRDLKPANILLDATTGEPRLSDFGLACERNVPEDQSRLTQSGVYLGSPGYWAPEQALGRLDEISTGTDVYGLGALLYAALTGLPPIQGDDFPTLFANTVGAPPIPPEEHSPAVEPWLSAVVLRCLEKRPQERFPSVEAVLETLAAGPPRRGALASHTLVAASALAALLVAGAVVLRVGLAPLPSDPAPAAASTTPAPPSPPEATILSPVAPDVSGAPDSEPTEAVSPTRAELGEGASLAELDAALALDPTHPRLLRLRARKRAAANRYAEALDDALALLRQVPDDAEVLYLCASARSNTGDPAGAIADYQALLRVLTDAHPEAKRVHNNIGYELGRLDRPEEALVAYDRALALDPDYALALQYRGNTHLALDQLEEALRDFTRAVALGRADAGLLHNRGWVLQALGRHAEALADLEAALRLGDRLETRCALGEAREAMGETDQARDSYRRATEGWPDAVLGWLRLGALEHRLGELDLAVEHLERAIREGGGADVYLAWVQARITRGDDTQTLRADLARILRSIDALLPGASTQRARKLQEVRAQTEAALAGLE